MSWNPFKIFSRRSVATLQSPKFEDVANSLRSEIEFSIRADSINESERSVIAVATTGNPVRMFDCHYWEEVDEILVPSGGSFEDELPMLDSHNRHSCQCVLGGVFDPSMIDNGWEVRLIFDEDEDATNVFRKIKKRFIKRVSMGYTVDSSAVVYIQKGMSAEVNGVTYTASDDRMLKVCSKWTANEVSPTPIAADKEAKIRAAVVMFGNQNTSHRHDELAADIHDAIINTGLPSDQVIDDMAGASGLDTTEINQILDGNKAPTTEQLEGFSAALDADLTSLA